MDNGSPVKTDCGKIGLTTDPIGACDALEGAKCVVTFLAEMACFRAFSGEGGMKISEDGEAGLHSILCSVARAIDEAIEKIPLGREVQ